MNDLTNHITGFERRLRILEGLSESTVASYRAKVGEFLQWLDGERLKLSHHAAPLDVGHVTRQDIEKYLERCFYIGNVNQTRYTKLIALRKYFSFLTYENITKEDITAGIPKPKIHRGLVQKFTKEEILRLFVVMDPREEKGLRDIVILVLGAFCGLRVGEITKLNIADIITQDEIQGQYVSVNVGNKQFSPKRDSYRTVSLWKAPSLFVVQYLSVRLSQGGEKNNPFLVSYRKGHRATGSRLSSIGIDKLIKKYAADARIKKPVVSMHMLRATHASNLRFIRGYDVFAIMQRLGHKDPITTARYVPVRDRISREYPSLASYWRDFNHVWDEACKT